MAPSVGDDPPEMSIPTAVGDDDCLDKAQNSCDDTFETASITLDVSRSYSDEDEDDDFHQHGVLQDPTDDERLLFIMDGSEEEMAASFQELLQQHSNEIWGVKQLRPIQSEALWHIVDHKSLLLISRTGSGKSHFVRMMGTIFGGIVVVVVPLLALMGDQMTKMKSVDGSVEAYNVDQLDEEADDFIDKKLIPRLHEMKESTTSTVFLFVSPHYLTRHSSMVDAIVDAKKRNALCAVGIDEAHLYALHSSFRMCIRLLENVFWKRIFPADGEDSWPKFFAMSATMTEEIINLLKELVGGAVDLGSSMRIWPSREHFEQRSILHQYYTRGGNNPYQIGVKNAVSLITGTEVPLVLVFTTLETNSIKIVEQIERALNKVKCQSHLVHVSGSKDKHTKFTLLQLLNEEATSEEGAIGEEEATDTFNLRGMVSTGAANTGIDLNNVRLVVRCGIPPDIITFLQERGRLAREFGSSGRFLLIGNIDSVAEQLWLIYNPAKKEKEDNEEQRSFVGANSALFTDSGRAAAIRNGGTNADEDRLLKEENKLKPRGNDILKIRERAEKMLSDVLTLLFLDKGCQHVISEQYCAEGLLREADPSVEPCGDSCPVCQRHKNGKRIWDETFHKMVKYQVINFFESRIVQDAFPVTVESGSLANLLWNSEEWILKIFRAPKKIPKYMVESAFLQLVAAKIIVAEYETKSKQLKWVLNRTENSLCYKIDSYWTGINLYEDSM